MSTILDAAAAVIAVDRDGIVRYASVAAADLLGTEVRNLEGKPSVLPADQVGTAQMSVAVKGQERTVLTVRSQMVDVGPDPMWVATLEEG